MNAPECTVTLQSAASALSEGRLDLAETRILHLLETAGHDARVQHVAGILAMLQARPRDAVIRFGRAVRLAPGMAQAHSNLGLARLEAGFGDEAVLDCRRAVELAPDDPGTRFNLGVVLEAGGNLDEAEAEYRHVLSLAPRHSEAHLNLGSVLYRQGKREKAEDAYRQGLRCAPDLPELNRNLGHLLLAQGRFEEAEACFRGALAHDEAGQDARAGLAAALRRQGRLEETVALCRAPQADADGPDLMRQLGMALLEQGHLDEAVAAFERGLAQRRAPGDHALTTMDQTEASRSKLVHDLEQVEYLARQERLPADFAHAPAALRAVLAGLPGDVPEAGVFTLPFAARRSLHGFYNRLIHRTMPPALDGGALNSDLASVAVEADYRHNAPGLTVVDDFLRPEALAGLRRFCLESTFWFDFHHPNGYVGAYMEEGFCCPLLLQVAGDLRSLMPSVIGDLPLRQLWAYKYDSRLEGIETHADFAAVNVNFWITPDEANLDAESGGMIVWDKEAPADWDFDRYNSSAGADQAAIEAFLRTSGAGARRIPHRQNRAVIFNSDLFHRTDHIRFSPGYESRRINITMLFGTRGAERPR